MYKTPSKSTSIFDYNVKIIELFEENQSKPTKVQMTAENEKNWLIKYYDIKGNLIALNAAFFISLFIFILFVCMTFWSLLYAP